MADDKQFKNIIKALQDLHKDNPDLRFGAVVQMAIDKGSMGTNKDLHDISSKKFLTHINNYNKTLNRRKER